MTGELNGQERIIVSVDADLEDLIPGFLKNRQADILTLQNALRESDFETLRVLGHSMKGAGGGYGFDQISEIGSRLEQAALEQDKEKILLNTEYLKKYLERVAVVFEQEGS